MKDEIVIVVDDNDNVINYHKRDHAHNHKLRHRTAIVWIENSSGEVLIARRSFSKKSEPGRWSAAVAGTVSKGESYKETALREIIEELGVSGLELVEVGKVPLSLNNSNFFMAMFKAVADLNISDFTIDENEVSEIKWINKDELFLDIANHPEQYVEGSDYYHKFYA